MTDYVKQGSDRPDYRQTLRDLDGDHVELDDAAAIQINVWTDNSTLLIDEPASVAIPQIGEVEYDFEREELTESGSALVEFRVEWVGGDVQWFPIDERGYELEIVPPPGPRGDQPSVGDGILEVADGETYEVDGTETYSRVVNAGTIRVGPGDTLRTR